MTQLTIQQFEYRILTAGQKLIFDCGDDDLNDFFHHDAIPHKKELVGVTYYFFDSKDQRVVSFFTVSNDAIETKSFEDELPNEKRYRYYPAVKIGRLGVDRAYHRHGIGSQVLNWIKAYFTFENKTGCRFITINAYNTPAVLAFYEKNNFSLVYDKDKNRETRIMKFDLKPYRDTLDEYLLKIGQPISFSSL